MGPHTGSNNNDQTRTKTTEKINEIRQIYPFHPSSLMETVDNPVRPDCFNIVDFCTGLVI